MSYQKMIEVLKSLPVVMSKSSGMELKNVKKGKKARVLGGAKNPSGSEPTQGTVGKSKDVVADNGSNNQNTSYVEGECEKEPTSIQARTKKNESFDQ
ncbi:MAG: hypothetical protein WCO92_04605 [Verrucomicrobiota bacterium]